MSDVLIAYVTGHGHTKKVVDRMAKRLAESGIDVAVWRADYMPPDALSDADAAMVAGSVKWGRHRRSLRDYVRNHVEPLNAMPSAFISVCGALGGSWARGPQEAQKYVDHFVKQTGWKPGLVTSVAGDLPYTEYGPFTRWFMKLVSLRIGRPTDTSRDWEFTDWDAVDGFADEFAQTLRSIEAVTKLGAGSSLPGRAS